MNTTSEIGTYPFTTAFQIVRDLEHAGIRADLTRSIVADRERYTVKVADKHMQRALTFVQ